MYINEKVLVDKVFSGYKYCLCVCIYIYPMEWWCCMHLNWKTEGICAVKEGNWWIPSWSERKKAFDSNRTRVGPSMCFPCRCENITHASAACIFLCVPQWMGAKQRPTKPISVSIILVLHNKDSKRFLMRIFNLVYIDQHPTFSLFLRLCF